MSRLLFTVLFFFGKIGNVVLGSKLNDAQRETRDVEESLQAVTN